MTDVRAGATLTRPHTARSTTRPGQTEHGWTEHRLRDVDARAEKRAGAQTRSQTIVVEPPGTSEAEWSVRVMMPALEYHGREPLPSICGRA